jgi:hypothetical protein
MKLSANGLLIHLEAHGHVSEDDWCRVTVNVADKGFSANFVAFLQSRDVEYFADNLAAMYKEVGLAKKAVLHCDEPGISVELESDQNGHIRGEYIFENETGNGFYPALRGIIDMDQSFLPEWEKSCREFIDEVRR